MENTTIKINCWEFKDGNEVPMLSTATLDGFEWNAKYRLTVSNDDGSLGLPFLFAADDTAILTVETSEQDGMGTGDKKIKQVISCVPRSLGNEITCSRIRSYNGKEHVWSAWETMSSAGGIKVDWDASSCVDTFIAAGIYNIRGERLNVKDGLPIANSNPGHTINARLVVIDSSISGTGDTDDKCITQILTLSNRTGGDGDVYIRTGRAQSTNVLAGGSGWEPWGKLQQNIEVGQVTSLNSFIGNGIYSGVYTNGSSFFETFVMVVINNYAVAGATGRVRSVSQFKYALNVDSTFSYKTRIGRGGSSIEWGSWVDLGAATTTDIQDNSITAQKLSSDVREKVEKVLPLEENATKEKNALLNGDTIVGLAREVYSRQGKVDTATFLKRTTAGGTSVSDGVATLKQIGGNIVKNLLDISTATYSIGGGTFEYNNIGIITCTSNPTNLVFKELEYISNHIYYGFVEILHDGTVCSFSLGGASDVSRVGNVWETLSCIGTLNSTSVNIYLNGATMGFVKRFNIIDLSEMFGAGNEPTKEECDKMFGTMDALPYGLTVANPTAFKSIGYNQWNPANLFTGKTVADKAIVDGNNSIAFFECLPCKIGAGENNGYVIGYGEGDDWSDAGIEVYLTPIYPMTGDGLLYAHKLEKDAATGTYIPKIKGYLLVVTPIVDKLCAHFLWSGDRAMSDYEPYTESTISLPVVPQMSEWGLAGMCVNGELVQDVIDLENNLYIKRIGKNAEGFYPLEVQEEYPIVTRNAPNYIGSDYGVEQFVGSKVPLVANILFYMRSLVSETRNFLDRLMDGLGVSDVTAAADKIVETIIPKPISEPVME